MTNSKLKTKTYQKPTNLHLFIPPNSSHPPGDLKSLIYGNLRRYWLQNSDINDFIEITHQFANCLSARGYDKNKIINLFSDAAKKLDGFINANRKRTNNETINLHWTWHPRDINR